MKDEHATMRAFFATRGFQTEEFPWKASGPVGSQMAGDWTVHPNTKAEGVFDGYVLRRDNMAFLVRTPNDFVDAMRKAMDE